MKKTVFFLFTIFLPLSVLLAQDVDVLHYRFRLALNDNNDSIDGQAEIKAVLKTADAVQFDLVQTGDNGKGMQVTKVEKDADTGAYPFSQKNNKIILPIIKGIPGDTILFRIFYKGIPGNGLVISRNKFGERTFFGDNWPNRAHHWLPCVDRPDDKASFEFLVTAPSRYSVVSNGKKLEEKILNDGKRFTHWREDVPLSTKVMVIGAARFAVKTFDESPKDLPVSGWVYPQDSLKGFYDFALAPSILRFLSGYIGPFPYSKLANVQSTTIFGGMENASCIFYAENLVTGNRSIEETMAHEIAHQWFGDMASEKSFAHLWLSEGFASYMTHLYIENKYGPEAFREKMQEEREEVIEFARRSRSPVVDSTANLMSLLNANSYQKGAWFLHMLRQEVGDSAFHQIIKTYYETYKGGNAETRDFEAVAEKISGKELKWFFDQWLYRPGIPTLNIAWSYKNGKVEILPYGTDLHSGSANDDGYQLKTELLLLFGDGSSEKHTLGLKPYGHELTVVEAKAKPVSIIVDPGVKLLFTGKVFEKKSR